MASVLSLSLAAAVAAPAVADGHIPAWEDVLAEAEGQTVNMHMWGGSDPINQYMDTYVADAAAELGITFNRVPADAADIVNKVLGEKQAGKDDGGSVDMVWINGENFKTAKQADLLFCDWATALPNRQYIQETAGVNNDYGEPVDGCESPWGGAQFVFVYDEAKVPEPPSSMDELLEWIEANPGQFTYPAPPDFTGSVFVRHVLYHAAEGGFESLLGPFDQEKFDAAAAPTWEILNAIEPYLWREGQTYPQDKAALDNLFSNGEVAMTMTYGPSEVGPLVDDGVYPDTTQMFVFDHGTIGNTHFVAIPYNGASQAGALAVANILISPEAQLERATGDSGWVADPIIDPALTEYAAEFGEVPLHPAVLSAADRSVNSNPELVAEYLLQTENGWTENVLQQ